MAEKTRKQINRKMVCIICGILAVIVVLTSLIFAFSKKENSTVLQATKSTVNAINLENNEHMHVEEDASGDKVPVPDISKFYGTDANGKKWGKQYQFSSSMSSSYDEITGTKPYNWSESDGVMTISSKTSYREPDIVKSYDYDSTLKTRGLGAKTTHEFLNQLEKEFNNMIVSVEKYGGFYIGRYETGNINQETPVVQKGNTDINFQTWYNMYKRCKNIKGDNTNVETGMIWGNQWDRTLMWLIETGSKTKEQIADDSTSWGNYNNATFEYVNSSGSTATKNEGSSTRIPTGSTEYTKANNIYDLAGNVWDWTMEASSSINRVCRGGHYKKDGDRYPADYRNYYGPTNYFSYLRLSSNALH